MKAFIYTGGDVLYSAVSHSPAKEDLCIVADQGYRHAKQLGIRPHLFVGDFDSLSQNELPKDIEVLEVPAEKDVTDTQLAVEEALTRGAEEIVIISGIGSRLDHTLSNLALLEDLYDRHVHAMMTNGYNRVRFIRSTSTLIGRSQYPYLSLITNDPIAKGVSIEGCKYPLKNAKIRRGWQFAVSNEISGNCTLISVRKGGLYLIESLDA